MIVAFSTSSPLASVAILDSGGVLMGHASEEARMNASGACLRLLGKLLAENECALSETTLFLADVGPGSFTGLKVGVTLAKTFAMAVGAKAGGLSAFDLIASAGVIVVPSKKGEFFWSEGGVVSLHENLPTTEFRGYGSGVETQAFPSASSFGELLGRVERVRPEALVPWYLLEPAISTPNKPFRGASGP